MSADTYNHTKYHNKMYMLHMIGVTNIVPDVNSPKAKVLGRMLWKLYSFVKFIPSREASWSQPCFTY